MANWPAFAMLLVFVILGIALWRLRSRFPGAQVHDAQGRGIDGASLSDAGRLGALVVVPILLVILLASSIRVVPVGHALAGHAPQLLTHDVADLRHLGGAGLRRADEGGAVAAGFAFLLGSAVLHLRGAYFAIATIGVNEAIRALVGNLGFLGGSAGLFLNFSAYDPYGGPGGAILLAYFSIAVLAILCAPRPV